jgi:hypothetical protein
MLGLDYTIEYKNNVDNKVADTLSPVDSFCANSIGTIAALTSISELLPQLSYKINFILLLLLLTISPCIKVFYDLKGAFVWAILVLRDKNYSGSSMTLLGGHSNSTVTFHCMK